MTASFKQEERVHYHARDMALARARLEGCAVVLASATPSLESAVAAGIVAGGPPPQAGWHHVALPARHGGARDAGGAAGRPPARAPAARWLPVAAPARGAGAQPRRRRPVAAVPQPPRLRPAHPVPRLRPPPRLPELLGLDGGAPSARPAAMPSLRLRDARARTLPELRCRGPAHRLRPGRRAPGRGAGASCCPRPASR